MPHRFYEEKLSDEEREQVSELAPEARKFRVERLLVKYPRFEQAQAFLQRHHRPVDDASHAVGSLAAVLGESRSGKSFMLRHYANSFPDEVEANRVRRRVVYVEVQAPSGPADLAEKAYLGLGLRALPRVKIKALMRMFVEQLEPLGVELVIFDDLQNIVDDRRGAKSAAALGFIKDILDSHTCNVVAAGPAFLYHSLFSYSHLQNRGGLPHTTMEPYHWEVADEREQFCVLLDAIDERLPFTELSGLGEDEVAASFYYLSGGLIGRAMNYIRAAAFDAINEGAECIQVEHLVRAAEERKPLGTAFNPFIHDVDRDQLTQIAIEERERAERALSPPDAGIGAASAGSN